MGTLIDNPKAVPRRSFGLLAEVSDDILLHIHREMTEEVERLVPELRAAAAKRNGLNQVKFEMELRQVGE